MTPLPRNPCGQVEQVGEPVEHVRLEFGGRRRGRPEHALDAEARGQQVAEDRRAAGVGGKVGEEGRVLPVGDAGQDLLVQVAQHRLERFAVLGWVRRQRGPQRPGRHLRQHRERLDPFVVVGDPVDDAVAVLAELRRVHVRAHARQCACPTGSACRQESSRRHADLDHGAAQHCPARASRALPPHERLGAPGGIRTHTGRVLSPLPLPVGIQGHTPRPS